MLLQLPKILIIVFLVSCTRAIKRKCMVHDSMLDHPERPRMPPKSFPAPVSSKKTVSRRAVSSQDQCEERYTIPVIWHIIMNSAGDGQVSDKTIKDAMNVLNDGFQNSSLHFRLNSIYRITNDTWSNDCVQKLAFMSKLAISPAINMNVYTCSFDIYEDQIVGNAAWPWSFEQDDVSNGVVIHPGTLPNGSIDTLNEGKSLVHEVGHYFGLYHYFENEDCNEPGDMVDDTPVSSMISYQCPKQPVDSCIHKTGVDPVHNYMGYAEDSCLYELTPGQSQRISWILDIYKNKLKSIVYRPCSIDAVFRWSNDYIYFFSGKYYYRYNETLHGIDPDYPRSISEHWRGVPDNIDGVFRYSNGITYFFKGSNYYRFNDTTLQVDPGYPKKISEFWKGIPNDIDDVIRYSNGHTYFFKDDVYYRFNSAIGSIDPDYPKPMQNYWNGIPPQINGAFTWYNGGVYFFKNSEFWLFTSSGEENLIEPLYPKSIKLWWNDPQTFSGYSVFRHCNGYTYFFLGEQYWRYSDYSCSVDFTYPQPLSNWRGMPKRIDGMFVWSNGYLYVFSAERYYRFNQTTQTLCQAYPKNIASFWKGIPDNIDAVFRSSNGLTYFFKDSSYYRFNDVTQHVDTGYPKQISLFWKGVPSNLDTVFRWSNGQTYFFKGNYYYQYNFTKGAVDDGYPRHVSGAWKGVIFHP